jgi:hypothetical protein
LSVAYIPYCTNEKILAFTQGLRQVASNVPSLDALAVTSFVMKRFRGSLAEASIPEDFGSALSWPDLEALGSIRMKHGRLNEERERAPRELEEVRRNV